MNEDDEQSGFPDVDKAVEVLDETVKRAMVSIHLQTGADLGAIVGGLLATVLSMARHDCGLTRDDAKGMIDKVFDASDRLRAQKAN